MQYTVMTLFPEVIRNYMEASIMGRALKKKVISLETVNIRDYTENKNRRVDDYIYGGGAGMLMQAQPVWDCYRDVMRKKGLGLSRREYAGTGTRVFFLSPQGRKFDQELARSLSRDENLIFLCGHYEGIDERVIEMIDPIPISVGDFVLTGGELAVLCIMDAVTRLIPGSLGSDDSAVYETFFDGLLEYPQYTRPAVFRDRKVPEILLSGDRAKIAAWKKEQALARTKAFRPDLYAEYMRIHPPEPEKRKRRKSVKRHKEEK